MRFDDAIGMEYGSREIRHRLLIDGGKKGARQNILRLVQELPPEDCELEFLDVSWPNLRARCAR